MTVEQEITELCEDILSILNDCLLVNEEISTETRVNYLQVGADFYRYLAEIRKGPQRQEVIQKARDGYKEAEKLATDKSTGLPFTSPILLSVALNYSIFLYDVEGDRIGAIRTAQTAFDNALKNLNALDESSYKETTLIVQLLRDNIQLWRSEK